MSVIVNMNASVNVSESASVNGSVREIVIVMTCIAGQSVIVMGIVARIVLAIMTRIVIVIFAPPMTTLTISRLECIVGTANVVGVKYHFSFI